MALEFRKAQKKKSRLRLGISGPAGAGKTMSALLIAYGICMDWDKICIIDSENESGDVYENYRRNGIDIGIYNVISLKAPYTAEKYIEAIHLAEKNGMEVIIIDSLTHCWAGKGGLLEQKGLIEDKTKNGWAAWRSITPMHNALVETMLSTSCHMIATLRAKMEYVQEYNEEKKKQEVRKLGMGSIARDGMEYEFLTFFDIDTNHYATSTKDRTGMFDGKIFKPSIDTGREFWEWLESGTEEIRKIQCADCQTVISGTDKMTLPDLIQYGTANHGRPMCSGCLKEMAGKIKIIKTNLTQLEKAGLSNDDAYREELAVMYGVDSCKKLSLEWAGEYIIHQQSLLRQAAK